MASKLLDMLGEVTETIRGIPVEESSSEFARVLLERRPEAFERLPGGSSGDEARRLASTIAVKQLDLLHELPAIVSVITDQLESGGGHPALRLMQTTALAYLVNTEDHLPDDLPAGYGFVDDSILLRATIVTSPQITGLPDELREREKLIIDFHGMCIPRSIAPAMERSVSESAAFVQLLAFLPQIILTDTARRIMENPLVSFKPQPPPGMTWPQQGGDWFSLPDGYVESSEDGDIHYCVEEGMKVSLHEGELLVRPNG